VKIDFCEADVLDAFDEWKRAVLVGSRESVVSGRESIVADRESMTGRGTDAGVRSGVSLPAHLERVVLRLTSARARGVIGPELDGLLDRIAHELDFARTEARGVRGEARQALIARLAALDRELVAEVTRALPQSAQNALAREAEDDLKAFRTAMSDAAFARARAAAIDQRVRERFALPVVRYDDHRHG